LSGADRERPWHGCGILWRLRQLAPFDELDKAEWAVFTALASLWDLNAAPHVSQAELVRVTGHSLRVLRDAIADLQLQAVVSLSGGQRPGERGTCSSYEPGTATLQALDSLRLPAAGAAPPAARAARPAGDSREEARASVGHRQPAPPLKLEELIKNLVLKEPPVAEASEPERLQKEKDDLHLIQETNETIVRLALTEWSQRRSPGAPSALRWNRADEERALQCAATVNGTAETKLQALRDSIEGALRVSNGPPTTRFIWGNTAHFEGHLRRGRAARLAAQQGAATAPPPAQTAAEAGASSAPPAAPAPRVSKETMAADLERLFGPSWSAKR
jgi:hypothetical protein